jgi:hypothetical protein
MGRCPECGEHIESLIYITYYDVVYHETYKPGNFVGDIEEVDNYLQEAKFNCPECGETLCRGEDEAREILEDDDEENEEEQQDNRPGVGNPNNNIRVMVEE